MSDKRLDNLIPFSGADDPRRMNGRPKGVPNTKTRLQRILNLIEEHKNPVTGELEKFTVAELLDMQQVIKARKGDTKAYQILLDRLEGRPQQSVDMTTNGKDLPTPILNGIEGINVSANDGGEEVTGLIEEN